MNIAAPIMTISGLEQNPSPQELYPERVTKMITGAQMEWNRTQCGALFQTPGFDRESEILAAIKAGATSWRALEIIYNFKPETDDQANLWVGSMANAQAVRNRLRGLKVYLHDILQKQNALTVRGTAEDPLRMLSLAAGSAQGVLEVVAEKKKEGIYTHVTLMDRDADVREVLKARIHALDLNDQVDFQAKSVSRFRSAVKGRFDVVEMAGLMDYLQFNFAVWLCRQIYEVLEDDGHFITCHIHENRETEFMRYVINWGINPLMLYRNKKDFLKILSAAQFNLDTVWTEPHCIHTIAIGQRASSG